MHYNIQKSARSSRNTCTRGFSLLEVLVALFILSWGLLGILSLQTVTLRRNYEAYLSSIATTLVVSRYDMQLNHMSMTTWEQDVKSLLPQGESKINSNNISVCWHSRLDNTKHCVTNEAVITSEAK